MDFSKENLTTVAVFIYMLISPMLNDYGVSIDQSGFTSIIVGIIGFLIAIISAKHPNTLSLLGNKDDDESC